MCYNFIELLTVLSLCFPLLSHKLNLRRLANWPSAARAQPQSNELTRGTTELVQHFRLLGGVHICARVLLDINLIWLGYLTRLISLVQIISTCIHYA